jgi:hypothetical protein
MTFRVPPTLPLTYSKATLICRVPESYPHSQVRRAALHILNTPNISYSDERLAQAALSLAVPFSDYVPLTAQLDDTIPF